MHLYIITLYVNDNTDNSHNSFAHLYYLLHSYEVSYIIISFMKNILVHPVNEKLYLFVYSGYILSRFIWKMWLRIDLHICLIDFIIAIFIMILTSTSFYGESTVESKILWMNFHVKLCLQCFSIIMFCHNRIIVRKTFIIKFLH